MNQENKPESDDEMRPEYDIRGGVRGTCYERYHTATNVVLLEPDVAAVFRDAESVNRALRLLVNIAEASTTRKRGHGLTKRSTQPRPRAGAGKAKRRSGRGG